MARVRLKILRQSDIENVLGNNPGPQQKSDYIDRWVVNQLWKIEAKKYHSLSKSSKNKVNEYRSSILIREYQENNILNNIMISENSVIEYYDKNQNEFIIEEQAAFVNIYSQKSEEDARVLLTKLKNNEDPLIGGYLKLVVPGDCILPIDEKIFSRNSKDLIGPIAGGDMYYIISIIHRYPKNSLLRVEHVREDIIQKLRMSEYINAIQNKEKELKEKINVKIFKNSNN